MSFILSSLTVSGYLGSVDRSTHARTYVRARIASMREWRAVKVCSEAAQLVGLRNKGNYHEISVPKYIYSSVHL